MLIPTTFDNGKEADFIIRIYSEENLKLRYINR